jgi:hypothetical protein
MVVGFTTTYTSNAYHPQTFVSFWRASKLLSNILTKSLSAPHCVEVKSRSGSIDVLYTDRYRGEVEKGKGQIFTLK